MILSVMIEGKLVEKDHKTRTLIMRISINQMRIGFKIHESKKVIETIRTPNDGLIRA